ncbi:MAG: endonuclease, partial [Saprospiraceae bacterium]
MRKIILFSPIYILAFLLFSCGTTTENPQVNNNENKPAPQETEEIIIKSNGIIPNNAGPEDTSIDRIACYNVENLFDTKDDANKNDSQFLPSGKNKWTQDRYEKKIKDIAKVINYMGVPGIMGLVEVENKNVLEDLINDPQLKEGDYKFVHEESPDYRGIDVALLYDSEEYKLIESSVIRINFPKSIVTNYTTRDVLHVILKRKRSEKFHIFINHWPSRRGGEMESQPKRVYVAEQV